MDVRQCTGNETKVVVRNSAELLRFFHAIKRPAQLLWPISRHPRNRPSIARLHQKELRLLHRFALRWEERWEGKQEGLVLELAVAKGCAWRLEKFIIINASGLFKIKTWCFIVP